MYATAAELKALPGMNDLSDDQANALLEDACDWVDSQLGARKTDPATGRKVIEGEVLAWQWTKLKRATLKVATRLQQNPGILTAEQWETVKGPDFETTGRLSVAADIFGTDVSSILDQSGLRVLTTTIGNGCDQPPWWRFSNNVDED